MEGSIREVASLEPSKAPSSSTSERGRWLFRGIKRNSQQQGVPEATWGPDTETNVLSEPSEDSSICELQGIVAIDTGSSGPYAASGDAEPVSPCHDFATPQGSTDGRGDDSAASTPPFSSARRSLWQDQSQSEAFSEEYSRLNRSLLSLRARRVLLPDAPSDAATHFLEDHDLGVELQSPRAGSEAGMPLPRQAGAVGGATKSAASRLLSLPRAISAFVTPLKNARRSRAGLGTKAPDEQRHDRGEHDERSGFSLGYYAAATPSRAPRRATYGHVASPVAHARTYRPSSGPGWENQAELKGHSPFQPQMQGLQGSVWPRNTASTGHDAPAVHDLRIVKPEHPAALKLSFDSARPSSGSSQSAGIVAAKMCNTVISASQASADGGSASENLYASEPGRLDQEARDGRDLVGTEVQSSSQVSRGHSACARGAPAVPPISAGVLKDPAADSSAPPKPARLPLISPTTGGLSVPSRSSMSRRQPGRSAAAPSRTSQRTAASTRRARDRQAVSYEPRLEYSLQDPVKVLERVRELEAQLELESVAKEARQRQLARARLTHQEERSKASYQQSILRGIGPTLASVPRGRVTGSSPLHSVDALLMQPSASQCTAEKILIARTPLSPAVPHNGVDARGSTMIKSRTYHRQTPAADKMVRAGDSPRTSWDSPDMSPGMSIGYDMDLHSSEGKVVSIFEEELSRRDRQWLAEIDKMVWKTREERKDLVRQIDALQMRVSEMEAAAKHASAQGSPPQPCAPQGTGAPSETGTDGLQSSDSKDCPGVKQGTGASGVDAEPDPGPPVSTAHVELGHLRSKNAELEGVVTELRTQLAGKDAQIAEIEKAHARSSEELQVGQSALTAAKAKIAEVTSENEVLRIRTEAAEEEQRRALAKIREMSTGGLVPQSLIIELQSEVDSQRREVIALKDAQKMLSAKLKESQESFAAAQQTLTTSHAKEEGLQAQINALQRSEKALQERIEMLRVSGKKAHDEAESWRKQLLCASEELLNKENEVRREREEMEAEVRRIKGEKHAVQDEVAALQGKLKWAQKKEEDLQKEILAKEAKCNDLQQALHEKSREVLLKEAELVSAAMEGQENKSTTSVLKVQIEGLQKALEQKEAIELMLHGEMEAMRASLREAREETSVAKSHYNSLEDIVRKAEKSKAELRFEAGLLENEVNRLKSENKALASKAAEAEKVNLDIRQKLAAAQLERQGLAEDNVLLEQSLIGLKMKYGDDDEPAGYGSMGSYG